MREQSCSALSSRDAAFVGYSALGIGEIDSPKLIEEARIPVALPSVRGLAALSALSRHRSHKAAAEALGITRSALSHRIADLEAELGARLVLTNGRTSELTETGEALRAAMGDALDKIEAAVAPLQRRRRQIRLTTVNSFAVNWLLPRVPGFQQAFPEVELSVSTSQRVIDLDQEDMDCAIRHGIGGWRGLDARLLFRETLIPVAASAPGSPDAWTPIRARTRFLDWRRWWLGAGRSGQPPDVGLQVENRAQALEAALAGAGVALTDQRYVEPLISSGRLVPAGPVIQLEEGYYFVRASRVRDRRLFESFEAWLIGQGASS